MIKRPTQSKHLPMADYLKYKKIEKEKGFFSDEMNNFLKNHNLPTFNELSEENLRIYIDDAVEVCIYNMNEIKDTKVND